ncbi:MAG: D-sedoheptulose 7-phosphate isomerase [Bacteroidetes bacterium]|nr:D-sedoheptulose 7-phosphate isomerase [Bacteroidota bacterium]
MKKTPNNDFVDHKLLIKKELQEASKVLSDFLSKEENLQKIQQGAQLMANAINQGGKIISCGNGGSFCDAMHFAEELSGLFREQRPPIPAVAISDPSHITCTANDYGFGHIFSRYIEAFGNKGDVLLAISTSGNSANILNATLAAKKRGMTVIALTGRDGGKLAKSADLEIRVAHQGYSDRIQEVHIKIIHSLIFLIEKMVNF